MVSEGGPTAPDRSVVLDQPDPARVREELVGLVLRDLHGPLDGPEEEFDADPVERYPLGRLAPAGTVVEPETLDDIAEAEVPDPAEGDPEPSAPNVASLFPSAIGLTTRVAAEVGELVVTAEWGRYERVASDSPVGPPRVWRRVPMRGRAVVRLAEGLLPPVPLSTDQPGVVVRGRARRYAGTWLVSLFLVNAQHGEHTAKSAWLFQASLSVTGPQPAGGTDGQDGATHPVAVFLPRNETVSGGDASDRTEQRRLAMAYRFHPEFAVGHATAVHPETDPTDPMRAWRVSTVAAPRYELPATDTPDPVRDPDLPELADVVVDMARLAELADGPPDALTAALIPLVRGYRRWIETQAATAKEPGRHLAGYQGEAVDALEADRRAASRIESGIAVLASDPRARRAFGFANRAMALQRVRTLAAERRRKDPELDLDAVLAEIDRPENRSWRPFQLAFILLNLPSLADPRHPERDVDQARAVADLLWFPTGGGKTEAYLGLTAFTLAARRLSPPLGGLDSAGGVGVLMRYTLRLLTIQQFQRAATLICAAETLRRDDAAVWGDTPFRLGLWVGGQVTPNRTDVAADWESDIRRGRGRGAGRSSPHQLTSCPWCGAAIDAGRDITVNKTRRRTLVVCPDVFCPFGAGSADRDGLPVVVVDEEIYRLLPGLVIATVDKFAQLPWKGETSALFGRVTGRCERHGYVTEDLRGTDWEATSHPARNGEPAARLVPAGGLRPPDLIIQDELHLISGPLGSLTGLYEAAVDRLCTWEPERGSPVRPKVIASTATVRRAPHQIGALFNRRTEVFPPPGLDASDSFFARQRPTAGPDAAPGRLYVGICSHGVRTKSTLIRAYVSVLGAAQRLHEKYGANEITDPYMTLVGYFNSLRELGGMRRLVEDDVTTRLARADQRGLARRYDPMLAELTSRLSSADIPKILDHLAVPFAPRAAGQRRPLDVLLATNMIAVGVDVSRLGLMVVANQPKSTAEYIQATSRVGRRAPGLVLTVFNWARPRDLSHYETFEHFHATVYRRVEALSVTPFADRALDRGLTGVLVALVRHLRDEYNGNLRAQDFDRYSALADHVVRYLSRRARQVAADNDTERNVQRDLDARLDRWATERLLPGRILAYDRQSSNVNVGALLSRPEAGPWTQTSCPTSLRDVEPGIRLLLVPNSGRVEVNEPGYTAPPAPPADTADTQRSGR